MTTTRTEKRETTPPTTDTALRRIAAVIPAAGKARRFGSSENKIWATIGDRSVLERTLLTFCHHPYIETIVVAAGEEEIDRVRSLVGKLAPYFKKNLIVVLGGDTRAESVGSGLKALPEGTEIVLVHDAARPLLSAELIDRIVAGVVRTGAAVPGSPLSDTVKRVDSTGIIRATVPRSAQIDNETISGLIAVQTPQGAKLSLLLQAYEAFDFSSREPTDEASLIEAMGGEVEVVPGEAHNIKITRKEDLDYAESLLFSQESRRQSENIVSPILLPNISSVSTNFEIRTGFGYDVHQFADPSAGRKLFLGGVEIPHDRGLEGHSDADVLIHAVCDALLGALSLGDIGMLFPNTDPAYKGVSSLKLLEVVRDRVREAGWKIVNVDSMLAAEAPKLLPYRVKMQETIAATLNLSAESVSVKATTNETMGFVGRREGMCCWSVATVSKGG